MRSSGEQVVLGMGSGESAASAVERAVAEARGRHRPLLVLRSWVPETSSAGYPGLGGMPVLPLPGPSRAQQAAEDVLQEAMERVGHEEPVTTTAVAPQGIPGQILTEASARSALVVIGGNGRPRWLNAVTGSTLGQVLRHAQSPVMVVPPDAETIPFRRVVLWLDPETAGAEALRWAHAEAARHHCPLEILSVSSNSRHLGRRDRVTSCDLARLDDFTHARCTLDGVPMRTRAVPGPAAQALVGYVNPEDLLVVQAAVPRGLARWLRANVAERCAQHAPCTVVVLPHSC